MNRRNPLTRLWASVEHVTVRHRTPFRARALALIGVMAIIQGLLVHSTPLSDPDYAIAYELIPIPVRMAAWITTGVLAVAFAWHPGRLQAIATGAALIMPAERAGSFLYSFVMWVVPGVPGGSLASLGHFVMWGCWTGIIVVLGMWHDPAPEEMA